MRKPVKAAVRKIAASCSDAAARTSAQTSSGLSTSISPPRGWLGFSTSATGLIGQLVELASAFEDPVQQHDGLSAAARAPAQRGQPRLDPLGRDVLDLELAERGQDLGVDQPAVALHGRGLAFAVVLDVAQVLGGRLAAP